MRVVYPGSFDPITKGHMDVITRASKCFEEVYVVVMENPNKQTMFTVEERMKLIETSVKNYQNVQVTSGSGLTVMIAKQLHADALLRGIRNSSDYALEELLAFNNQHLDHQIETIIMIASPAVSFISSSGAKEVLRYGGALDGYVEEHVKQAMLNQKKWRE